MLGNGIGLVVVLLLHISTLKPAICFPIFFATDGTLRDAAKNEHEVA